MITQALSTMARYRLSPVVVLVDNGLYGYEQYLIDKRYFQNPSTLPQPYVELNRWDYAALARAMGLTSVFDVSTPDGFRNALAAAKSFAGPVAPERCIGTRGCPMA
jgi:indolepyruvate decarboxylase